MKKFFAVLMTLLLLVACGTERNLMSLNLNHQAKTVKANQSTENMQNKSKHHEMQKQSTFETKERKDKAVADYRYEKSNGKNHFLDYINAGNGYLGGSQNTVEKKPLRSKDKDSNKSPSSNKKIHRVRFLNHQGQVIRESFVPSGESAQAPKLPKVPGYHFVGWDEELTNIHSDLTVRAIYELNRYPVTFRRYDGKVLGKKDYPHGISYQEIYQDLIENADRILGLDDKYYVSNVSEGFKELQQEEELVVYKDIKKLIIEYYVDGEMNDVRYVDYGEEIPEVLPKKEKVGHDFIAWDKDVPKIAKPSHPEEVLKLNAVYKNKEFDVKYYVDGQYIHTEKVLWNEKPKGLSEKKIDEFLPEGYRFVSWDNEFSGIKEDTVYNAKIALNEYEVKILDSTGKLLKTQTVAHGDSIKLPENNEVKEGYHFKKWSHDGENITSDLVIRALFELNEYKVKFVDGDGHLLSEEIVKHGEAAPAPEVPSKEHYDFLKWDQDISEITSDMTVKAIYGLQVKDVTFLDFYGDVVAQRKVEYGQSVEDVPVLDKVQGYRFIAWDQNLHEIKDHMIVKPLYEKKYFTVDYVVNNKIIHTESVQEGRQAPSMKAPEKVGYNFIKWRGLGTPVLSDTEVHAEYRLKEYKVDFIADGKVIDSQVVKHGQAAKRPQDPSKVGHTFVGWKQAFDKIQSDIQIEAEFEINTYKIQFDMGGHIVEEKLQYGDKITYPKVKEIEGKDFVGWDQEIDTVTSDLKITAIYETKTFQVVFKDKQGKILKKELVEYGRNATAPQAPDVQYMDFVNWDKDFSKVKDDLVIFPIYEKQKGKLHVNIVMREKNGKVIADHEGNHTQSFELDKGTAITFEKKNGQYTGKLIIDSLDYVIEIPSYEGFTIAQVENDQVILDKSKQELEVSFYSEEYSVQFYDYEERLLKSVTTYHGGKVSPDIPEKDLHVVGKVFIGWDQDLDRVTKNLRVYPKYTDAYHTVRFVDYQGNKVEEFEIKHGDYIDTERIPVLPEVEHKIFKEWDFAFDQTIKGDIVINPVYENKVYSVHFYTGANTALQPYKVLREYRMEYGDEIPYDQVPDAKANTFIFKGWDQKHDTVTGTMHIYPIFEEDPKAITIPVEYLDADGNLQVKQVRGYAIDENAEELGKLVNEYRIENGKKPLAISSKLNHAALERAAQIVLDFSHNPPSGKTLQEGVKYGKYISGENIAYGNRSPEMTLRQWQASEGHNANILRLGFTAYGSAGFQDELGSHYWVQLFSAFDNIEIIENEASYE